MTQTKEKLNIYQKILKITEDVGAVQKEEKKVNNQYKFVSHEAVTDAIRPLLIKYGVTAIPTVVNHTQDGNNCILEVMVTFTNVEKPDDSITVHGIGYGVDPQDKGPGKSFSFAVKYIYMKVFNLSSGDDDNERSTVKRESSTTTTKINGLPQSLKDRLGVIVKAGQLTNDEGIALCNKYGYNAIKINDYLDKIDLVTGQA